MMCHCYNNRTCQSTEPVREGLRYCSVTRSKNKCPQCSVGNSRDKCPYGQQKDSKRATKRGMSE